MHVSKNIMGAVTASLLLLAMIPGSANAFALTKTFDFFGKCDDCAGELVEARMMMMIDTEVMMEEYEYLLSMLPFRATGDGIFQNVFGTLELQNFNPGVALTNANFVSFSYGVSSILGSFTIAMGDLTSLTGTLDADGNVLSDININWTPTGPLAMSCLSPCNLNVQTDGDWSIGPLISIYELDVGISGTFAGAPIPEPGTLALFGLGLLGLGVARRRKAA